MKKIKEGESMAFFQQREWVQPLKDPCSRFTQRELPGVWGLTDFLPSGTPAFASAQQSNSLVICKMGVLAGLT